LNGEMALILRYFTEFASFRGALCKSGLQSGRQQIYRPKCMCCEV